MTTGNKFAQALYRSNEKSKSVESLGQARSRYVPLLFITIFSLIASIYIFFIFHHAGTLSFRSSIIGLQFR